MLIIKTMLVEEVHKIKRYVKSNVYTFVYRALRKINFYTVNPWLFESQLSEQPQLSEQ